MPPLTARSVLSVKKRNRFFIFLAFVRGAVSAMLRCDVKYIVQDAYLTVFAATRDQKREGEFLYHNHTQTVDIKNFN